MISLKLSKASDERLMSIGLWSAERPLATALKYVLRRYCPLTIADVYLKTTFKMIYLFR